ncbi:MAG: sulfatase [Tepidisphaeraceae bacterium]
MSGQYSPRTGIYTVGSEERFDWRTRSLRPVANATQLPLDKITIAQQLQHNGYVTGLFGKWHLGTDAAHHPSRRGFTEAIESAGQHFNFKTDPPVEVKPGEYLADFLTDKAVDFIDRHKDQPFFLYVPHYGVHAPHVAKQELVARFKDKPAVGGHHDPVYAAMIASVDESVGRIVAKLDELKLSDNTLVIFSSDNGGVGGYAREGLGKPGITDNSPLRGGKGMLYEGGIRVPYIFRWPGHVAEGGVNESPIQGIDFYPTLLELAGVKKPENYPIDGTSYAPQLLTPATAGPTHDALYWHFPGYLGQGKGQWRTLPVSVVHSGDWKLLQFLEDDHLELYNLKADPSETKNLAQAEPERAQALLAKLQAWRTEIKAPLPRPITEADKNEPRKKKKALVDNDD